VKYSNPWVVSVVVGLVALAGCQGEEPAPGSVESGARSPAYAEDPLVVVGLGDSIQTSADARGDTFLDVYARHLEESTGRAVDVQSFADPAATSSSVRQSLAEGSPAAEAVSSARLVVVTVGGNDADPFADRPPVACSPRGGSAACLRAYAPNLAKNLGAILARIDRLRGPDTDVVLTSPDFNPFVGWSEAPSPSFGADFYRQVASAETRAVCRLAPQHHAECLDFFHVFNGPSGAEDAGAFLADDHAHPGPRGVRVIADALVDLVGP